MLYYFAYGSNMLHARLQARVPSAKPMGMAILDGYRLVFHKKSTDGSVKCDLVVSSEHHAYGVLFQMKKEELPLLDQAEGVGFGYIRVVRLLSYEGNVHEAFLYLAQPEYIELGLPYDWYLQFVLEGAKQNDLPFAYIQKIEEITCKKDEDVHRTQKNREILNQL